MSKQLLVRNLPNDICTWIDQQRGTAPDNLPFTFIDLFAGIGGFRSALQKLGGRCLFSSEWDKYSQKTYKAWYGETPHGDINQIAMEPSGVPDHDVLAAGFPCQPFSIAGVSKRQSLGMAHGFKCVTQGNLFFQLVTVIKAKRPPVASRAGRSRRHDGN
ncbi:MAG: DNA (cytosine-5-)-methyltransferase [Bryobacteraceae bacterium]|nr:DNA (cytosine-5-)-methyltransferase [Bryobacteraceae bacterium]